MGALYLAQFPTFSNEALHANEMVATLFIAVFTIGIAMGSLACNKLLKGVISAKYVPLAALAITIFSIDLYFASRNAVSASNGTGLADLSSFLSQPGNWRILFDLLMIAFSGGLYAVPLYALIQEHSDPAHVSRNIAANNIVNALFMVVSTVLAGMMLSAGYTIRSCS